MKKTATNGTFLLAPAVDARHAAVRSVYGFCHRPYEWFGNSLGRRFCLYRWHLRGWGEIACSWTAQRLKSCVVRLVRRMHQVSVVPLRFGADIFVMPVSCVRDLGVYLDANASMKTHITRTAASCFGILHQLQSVQRSLPRHAVVSVVTCLVLTMLDYCNSQFVGLSTKLLNRLQVVINTRLVYIININIKVQLWA